MLAKFMIKNLERKTRKLIAAIFFARSVHLPAICWATE
jgi:hypothetical protein